MAWFVVPKTDAKRNCLLAWLLIWQSRVKKNCILWQPVCELPPFWSPHLQRSSMERCFAISQRCKFECWSSPKGNYTWEQQKNVLHLTFTWSWQLHWNELIVMQNVSATNASVAMPYLSIYCHIWHYKSWKWLDCAIISCLFFSPSTLRIYSLPELLLADTYLTKTLSVFVFKCYTSFCVFPSRNILPFGPTLSARVQMHNK